MKKLLSMLLTLAALSAALCLTAAAAEPSAPTRVWGKVSPWDGEGIFLKNDDKNDHMNEAVLQAGEEVYAVDASTGLPLDLKAVKEGDTLYAWIGPAATMSLPPQVFPIVIVGNVPADAKAPEYYKLASAGWKAPEGGTNVSFSILGSPETDLTVPLDAEVTPWLTKQIIRLEDLDPGTEVLVWRDGKDTVTKVLVFPYAYQGYASWSTAAAGVVNGEAVSVPGKTAAEGEEKICLLPIRAIAEAAGYDVRWDKDLGAVVSLNGETVLSAKPGADVIQTPNGEAAIASPCVIEKGVTYLPAEGLCYWLNLFFTAE